MSKIKEGEILSAAVKLLSNIYTDSIGDIATIITAEADNDYPMIKEYLNKVKVGIEDLILKLDEEEKSIQNI